MGDSIRIKQFLLFVFATRIHPARGPGHFSIQANEFQDKLGLNSCLAPLQGQGGGVLGGGTSKIQRGHTPKNQQEKTAFSMGILWDFFLMGILAEQKGFRAPKPAQPEPITLPERDIPGGSPIVPKFVADCWRPCPNSRFAPWLPWQLPGLMALIKAGPGGHPMGTGDISVSPGWAHRDGLRVTGIPSLLTALPAPKS